MDLKICRKSNKWKSILIQEKMAWESVELQTVNTWRNALAISILVCNDWICKLLLHVWENTLPSPLSYFKLCVHSKLFSFPEKTIIMSNQIFKIPTSPPVASKEPSLLNVKANCSPTSSNWLSTSRESFSPSFSSPASFLVSNLNKLNKESTILIKNQHFSSHTVM